MEEERNELDNGSVNQESEVENEVEVQEDEIVNQENEIVNQESEIPKQESEIPKQENEIINQEDEIQSKEKEMGNKNPPMNGTRGILMDFSLIKTLFFKNLENILCFFVTNNLLPEYFPSIQLAGSEPRIDDIQYYKVKYSEESDEEYLLIDAFIDYSSPDGSIKTTCHRLPIQFKQFRISGRIRLALKPFKTKPISFGGVQFSFIEPPTIKYKLNLAALPFKKMIENKINHFLESKMMFPGRVVIPIGTVDPIKYRSFMPIGLFAIRVKRLTVGEENEVGLCSSCFGRRCPRTYHAQIAIGASRSEFDIRKDTDIEEEKWSEFLLEVFQDHRVFISLCPYGSKQKPNSSIGAISFDVLKELGGEEGRYKRFDSTKKVELSEDGVLSLLYLEMVWLPSKGSMGEDSTYSGPTVALFSVYIYSCNNLVESEGEEDEVPPDTYIEISHGGEDDSFSFISRSETFLNSRQPEFNYENIIKCNKEWLSKNISITVCRGSNTDKHIYGGINLCLAEIEKKPIVRQVRSIHSEVPYSTMTLSASIKKLLH